jgi:hypothetical protein
MAGFARHVTMPRCPAESGKLSSGGAGAARAPSGLAAAAATIQTQRIRCHKGERKGDRHFRLPAGNSKDAIMVKNGWQLP